MSNRQALIDAVNELIKNTDELPFDEGEVIYLFAGLGLDAGLTALLKVVGSDDTTPPTINVHLN